MSIMNWPSLSLFSSKPLPLCKGKISVGAITKVLLRDLPPGRIVVLQHRDLDEVIAQELIDRKVKAIINCQLNNEWHVSDPRTPFAAAAAYTDLGSGVVCVRSF